MGHSLFGWKVVANNFPRRTLSFWLKIGVAKMWEYRSCHLLTFKFRNPAKLIWLCSINDFCIFEQLNIAATAMFFADFLKRKPTNWMMLEISNHICWSLNSVVSKKHQAPSGCRRFFQDFGINRFEEEAFNKTRSNKKSRRKGRERKNGRRKEGMKNRQEAKDLVTLECHFCISSLGSFFCVPFENRLAGSSWKSSEPGSKKTFWEYTTLRSWWKVACGD